MLELDSVDVAIDVELDDLDDELELTDDDFVLLESAPPAPPISRSTLRAALAAAPDGAAPEVRPRSAPPISAARLETLRTKTLLRGVAPGAAPSPSLSEEPRRAPLLRMSFDAHAESNVADECLASIAVAASHARVSDPFVPVAAPAPIAARPSERAPFARSSERFAYADSSPRVHAGERSPVDDLLDDADDAPAMGRLPPASVPPRGLSAAAMIPPPASSSSLVLTPRLPRVCAPPFLRPSSSSFPAARPSVPGVSDVVHPAELVDADAAETLPVPSRALPAARASAPRFSQARPDGVTPFARTSIEVRSPAPSAPSVAPVAVSNAEPTVIVVRDRPRTAWVVAAAAIGALAAVTVMRFGAPRVAPEVTPPSPAAAVVVDAPITAPASPATALQAVASPASPASVSQAVASQAVASPASPASASPRHAADPAVVRFGDDDGVSIKVAPGASATPPTAPAAAQAAPRSAPKPARPSRPLNPKVSPPTLLPDGSLGLANNSRAPAPTVAPAATPLPVPPPPPRRRALTPEQELAEAQLRAATR
ncbi:MAG: hypothetical protein KF795_17110 [Labilithrix sp.]|nr:hypothetical protein [Labilithrix sp.]